MVAEHRQRQFARINELSVLARNSWLVLLAFLAYIGITLLAVQDADFFVPSRKTELPLVGISIPTFSFFAFAPPLAAALYIYLHIHLLKLFDALATAPARVDGEPIGDLIHPWLANDLLLTMRSDDSLSDRPLRKLSNFASLFLVWVASPLVLAGFWWRSMPAHDEWLTLALALFLLIAVYTGFTSWWSARSAAKRKFKRPWSKPWRGRSSRFVGVITVLSIVSLSWFRTEGGLDHYFVAFTDYIESTIGEPGWFDEHTYPKTVEITPSWYRLFGRSTKEAVDAKSSEKQRVHTLVLDQFSLARTDLIGVDLVNLPEFWRSSEIARLTYRERWCSRVGLGMLVCSQLHPVDQVMPLTLSEERKIWCAQYAETKEGDCLSQFESLNERFIKDWKTERLGMLATLPKIDLKGRDLRNAEANRVSLVNANLNFGRLDGAVLTLANMESVSLNHARLVEAILNNANFRRSSLYKADLRGAQMDFIDLRNSTLRQADLRRAYLSRADLFKADLTLAKLQDAQFFSADLRNATLDGAMLTNALLPSADLRKASLLGAVLEGAWLSEANLEETNLDWTVLSGADLEGVRNLTQAQLKWAVGDKHTILPSGVAPDTGKPFYVWSCWSSIKTEATALGFDTPSQKKELEKFLCRDQVRKRIGAFAKQK